MKRIIFIVCLLAGIAQAQSVIIVTNNVLALPTVSTSAVAGTIRITEYLRQGANPIDINNNTGQVFVTDIRDGAPSFSFNITGTNVVATNGQIRYAFTLSAGPTYDVRTFIYPQDGSPRYASGIYSLTVTSATAAATSVTINQTNLISVTNDILINATSVVNLTSITTNQITVNATSSVSVTSIQTNNIVITNTTSFSGTFSFTTNLYFQANGLNVVTPTTESTNVSGTWTITIGTNSAAMLYTQTGAITSIVTALGSNVTTNDVALAFVGLRGNGSSVTWPTSQWVWASSAAPTVTSNQWNMYYIQLWKNERHVATIGDTP